VPAYGPQNDVTLKMPAFEWVHVQLHQQKGMISLSPPTICNSALKINGSLCRDTNKYLHGFYGFLIGFMYDGNAFIPSAFAVLTSMYRRLIRTICILPHIYRFFRYSHENDTLRSYQGMGKSKPRR
ncbi:hypothetical protein, partial [Enterobacter hormaechei]|uniref:hypothetical protein n=1 Tax=Enterobacter hormaechei TaxID=158836 RepID=UPI0031F3163E